MTEDKRLYAVTEGNYSDYHIVTLCSSRKVADEIADNLNKSDEFSNYQVEEYVDGVIYHNANLHPYFVRFDKGSCSVEEENNSEYCYRGIAYGDKDGTIWGLYVFAENKQDALKIASEKRAKLIAERTGVV